MAKDNYLDLSEVEIYLLVLKGSLRAYPSGFFNGVDGFVSAKKIFRYVFDNILNWSLDDIKLRAKMPIIDEYKLTSMISTVFDGSIFIAIGECYPELKEWADEEYKKHDPVSGCTDEELINFIQEKARELNRIPKASEMHRPSSVVYVCRFGSWEKSLMKAGLIKDIYAAIDFDKYSKEDVLGYLKEISLKKERVLEKSEIFEIYPEGLIKEYFGSYISLQKILENDYTKEELINILRIKRDYLNRIPTNKDIKFPRPIVFIDKFGSWQDAVDELKKV